MKSRQYRKTKNQRTKKQRTKKQRTNHKGGKDLQEKPYKLETPYTNAELLEIRRHAEAEARRAEEERRQAEAEADERPYADGEQPAALRALLRWG